MFANGAHTLSRYRYLVFPCVNIFVSVCVQMQYIAASARALNLQRTIDAMGAVSPSDRASQPSAAGVDVMLPVFIL